MSGSYLNKVWKDIPEWNGLYKVSLDGQVLSVRRNRLLSIQKTPTGYLFVGLNANGRTCPRYIHRLVAATFIGPCPSGCEVCHIDGNKENNNPDNLYYGTRKQNVRDSIRHGTFKRSYNHVKSKLTPSEVYAIRWLAKHTVVSDIQLAEAFQYSRSGIGRVVRGETYVE